MFIRDRDFWNFVVVLIAVGSAIGVLLVKGLPWLWLLLKPWLHALTG